MAMGWGIWSHSCTLVSNVRYALFFVLFVAVSVCNIMERHFVLWEMIMTGMIIRQGI